MYLCAYNGRDVTEMSQKELLEYASEAFMFNASAIIKDKCPFALDEFMHHYEYVCKALDKRIQLHKGYNHLDEDYFSWVICRNSIEKMKTTIKEFSKKEHEFFDLFVESYPDKDKFLLPLNNKKHIEWLRIESEKAESFESFAKKAFPFLKPEQEKKWNDYHSYFRAINDLVLFNSEDSYYGSDSIRQLEELYDLYLSEKDGRTQFTLYSEPQSNDFKSVFNLVPTSNKQWETKKIMVSAQAPLRHIDGESFTCLTAEFLLSKGGRWTSVKSFMEACARALFHDGGKAKVVMYDYGYGELKNKGHIEIDGSFYQFHAELIDSPLENKYKHLKIYILPAADDAELVDAESMVSMIDGGQPFDALGNVIEDLSNVRISHKAGEANPNKAILLLSVLQAIQEGTIDSCKIYPTAALAKLFMSNWGNYASSCHSYKPLFEDTFYRLKAEPFWCLLKKDGEPDFDNLQTKQMSPSDFACKYEYAALYDLHYHAMLTPELQELIKDILLRIMECDKAVFMESLDDILKRERKNTSTKVEKKIIPAKEPMPIFPYPIPVGTTSISAHAYQGRMDIENLVIPEGVKVIGNLAFAGCENIRSVSFPNSLIEIGNGAFKRCISLQKVSLPDKVKSIGKSAFACCDSLIEVDLPDSLKDLGARAFFACVSIKSIVIPKKVRDIGDNSFEGCRLLSSLTLSEGIAQINSEAFLGCQSLSQVTIPASVHWVGDRPFAETSLAEISYANGNDICYLNPYKGIPSLKTVNIPSSCTFISTPFVLSSIKPNVINIDSENKIYEFSDGVLYNRKEKTLVYCRKDKMYLMVKPGTRVLGTYSLSGCTELQEIDLPGSLVKIEDNVFTKCKKLSTIYVPNATVKRLVEREINCSVKIKDL